MQLMTLTISSSRKTSKSSRHAPGYTLFLGLYQKENGPRTSSREPALVRLRLIGMSLVFSAKTIIMLSSNRALSCRRWGIIVDQDVPRC